MKSLVSLVFLFLAITANASPVANETIHIQGNYQGKRTLTSVEKLKVQRRRLEARNEALVKKQIETIRLQQELILMKKMRKAFDNNLETIENI